MSTTAPIVATTMAPIIPPPVEMPQKVYQKVYRVGIIWVEGGTSTISLEIGAGLLSRIQFNCVKAGQLKRWDRSASYLS